MNTVLELEQVTVTRQGKNIVKDVTWRTELGEHWVILGPNGAGKTTLMNILSARGYPSRGKATILGETLGATDVNDLRIRIGYTSQTVNRLLLPSDSVSDIVLCGAYGTATRWRQEYEEQDHYRVAQLLEFFGITRQAKQRFGTLSEGEKQKTLLAKALMADPELLLLDEPTAGLDLGGREQLLASLTDLSGSALAPMMIMVTHHVEQIPPGFTHALLLKDGEQYASGPIDEIITANNLSDVFSTPLRVGKQNNRFWAYR